MKHGIGTRILKAAFAGLLPFAAMAAMADAAKLAGAHLPPVSFADTETATNVPFAAWRPGASRIAFTLSCLATPSNNVEVAFGRDADSDGVLAVEETDFVVGWDCGEWFAGGGVDCGRTAAAPASAAETPERTLSCRIRLDATGNATGFAAAEDGSAVFRLDAGNMPSTSAARTWDTLRLTGRGLDRSSESLSVSLETDPFVIRFR